MKLSADCIVLATKLNESSVVLNRKEVTESTFDFNSMTDCLYCMDILTNQLNLIRLGMSDTGRVYSPSAIKAAYTYIANFPRKD